MTLSEAMTLLRASEALVKCGRGACNQKTYDAISAICIPQQRISEKEFDPNQIHNLCFAGIELSVSPFVEDGVIVPMLGWSYRDRETT